MTPIPAAVVEARVRAALRRVVDPEAGLNIVDLGLVHRVEATPDRGVVVTMTMTRATHPMTGMIVGDVHDEVHAVQPGLPLTVDLVWDPPWTPDRLGADALRGCTRPARRVDPSGHDDCPDGGCP